VLLLRHPLAPLLDDRTHENLFRLRRTHTGGPGGTPGRPRQPSRRPPSSRIVRRGAVSRRCRSSCGGTR
jgi:hypothetical protein